MRRHVRDHGSPPVTSHEQPHLGLRLQGPAADAPIVTRIAAEPASAWCGPSDGAEAPGVAPDPGVVLLSTLGASGSMGRLAFAVVTLHGSPETVI